MFGKRLGARSMRRMAIGVLAGMAIGAGYGCGGDSTGPVADINGIYFLQSYNGEKLPVTVSSQVLRWGELVLSDNASFSMLLVVTEGSASPLSEGAGGTYTRNGNQLEFRIPHPGGIDQVHAGSVSGTTVTMEFEKQMVFRRVLAQ